MTINWVPLQLSSIFAVIVEVRWIVEGPVTPDVDQVTSRAKFSA